MVKIYITDIKKKSVTVVEVFILKNFKVKMNTIPLSI
jgi:hypothetical protein